MQESDDNVIRMDDDDPDALDCYLEFLYRQSIPYALDDGGWNGYHGNLAYHELIIRTYQIADKYDAPILLEITRDTALSNIHDMEEEALSRLAESIDLLWSMGEAPSILSLRTELLNQLVDAFQHCDEDMGDNHSTEIQAVLNRNPEMAREIITRTACNWGAAMSKLHRAEKDLLVCQQILGRYMGMYGEPPPRPTHNAHHVGGFARVDSDLDSDSD